MASVMQMRRRATALSGAAALDARPRKPLASNDALVLEDRKSVV